MSQFHGVLNSRMWRITAPLRWFMHQMKLLKQQGLFSRVKALMKKIVRPKEARSGNTVPGKLQNGKLQNLNPHARRIHAELKAAILKGGRKDS